MRGETERTERVFRLLYFLSISLIAVTALVGFIAGFSHEDDRLGNAVFAAGLALMFFAQPLFLVWLVINIWGSIRYPNRRWAYAFSAGMITAWMIWGIYKYATMPMP